MSKFWWYAFHRQHKPPSSPEQRIFPLIFIATIRQIFCLSPLLLMRIRCQFFPSWIPFEHSNFSLRLQPHSPIKPDWSDLRDLNFDCIQFSGFRTQWCNARSSLRCPCTIDWQFSRPARLIFPSGASRPIGNIRTYRMRVETIFGGLPCRCSLTPCVSPSRAPFLSFAHYFQVYTFISYYLQTCLASFCTGAFSILNLAYNAFTYTASVLWILVSEVFREIFLPVRRSRGTRDKN